jgi:hypothetical protein
MMVRATYYDTTRMMERVESPLCFREKSINLRREGTKKKREGNATRLIIVLGLILRPRVVY